MSKETKFNAWDVVRLKNRTGRYRVYSHSSGWVFACMDADVITDSNKDSVSEVIKAVDMSDCEYVKRHYGVPAEIGRRVLVDGRPGIIAQDRGNYIGVSFDDAKPGIIENCHPTWEVKYLGMGKL